MYEGWEAGVFSFGSESSLKEWFRAYTLEGPPPLHPSTKIKNQWLWQYMYLKGFLPSSL
jgi:hypothetical protein